MKLDNVKFDKTMVMIAESLNADPHHRLLSWDHAWEHWNSFSGRLEADDSLASLHLAFYLASWGMYRGSSDLLFRDYRVLIPAVQFLKKKANDTSRKWKDCIFCSNDEIESVSARLRSLSGELVAVLKPKLVRPGKVLDTINISDTLLSKILLNTLSCVPAFDTEVKAALQDILKKEYPIGNAFDRKRLAATIEIASDNVDLIQTGQTFLYEKTRKLYPLTKVFDLYLWHHGLALPRKRKNPK